MKRLVILLVALGLFSFSTASAFQGGGGESTKKGPSKKNVVPKKKNSNVRLPKELILQMARDNERVKSCLQEEEGGNTVKFAAKNLSADLLDLNRDGKPEWVIEGEGCFCGNRTCARWIYREAAGKYELLLEDGVPLDTFTNGYKDLQVGFGPYIPTIFTYDGKRYKEGYNFTLDQIIMPSKLGQVKKLVCNDSKKRLAQVSKDDIGTYWYEKDDLSNKSYDDTWQEKMKKECWEIQLEKFKISNNGISFYYDTTIGFPMAILSEEPSSEYFYSWVVLKRFLIPSSPISTLAK